ncbi:MAG TPA: EAL domain-containing protein, partial [Lamprocystis sp. (in: g-proteobacteria)]|nr:EAL domain-containing protein [Lamprocystis sp. (in: g-proteobacteria)]
ADLYDFAQVAYATLSREGRVTQMNLTAAELLGVERGQRVPFYLANRLTPGDGRTLLAALARVLASGAEESIEVGLGRPPSALHTLRLTIRRDRARPANAAPVQCRCALFDVTEIRQAQAALLAQQRFLQAVIDGVADPILVIGTDYRVLLMNTAARAAAVNAAGLTCHRAIHGRDAPCDSPDHPCPVRQVLAGGASVTVVHRHPGADGQPHWIELVGSPLHDALGAVVGVVESARDITTHLALTQRLLERETQLAHQAQHDALTGLPNRLLFIDRLNQALRQAQREQQCVALLFLDLDHLKAINDSLGHTIGDQLLRLAAARMVALVRESDTVARLGGDEFTLIIPALGEHHDAGLVADKLVEAFRQPFILEGRSLYLTASIGISLFPQDGTDADTLIRNADAAMYRAKSRGRNSFRYYAEEMTAQAVDQVSMESALHQALANQEFLLHYQPQHDLTTGRIVGLEALIRWQHPALGLIGPDRFIPLAESTGFILPINAWVVRTAAAQMKQWRDQGLLAGAAVWVNLSHRDLQNRGLAEEIAASIRAVGLDLSALAVEITENWIMADPESVAGNLQRLQALGIAVGIDDFGTGYSSLAALSHLALTALKIDRSCVAPLPGDLNCGSIVRAVIALGQALRLKVVAEGVETQAQADFLRDEGCLIGQGGLFSRALTVPEVANYVRGLASAPVGLGARPDPSNETPGSRAP